MVEFQGRSQDFSKGGSQRLLTRSTSGDRQLYMVYTAALPRVSAGSVVLSRHEGPYYFGGARSKGFATLRNVSKLQFFDKIGHAKFVGVRFYSAI